MRSQIGFRYCAAAFFLAILTAAVPAQAAIAFRSPVLYAKRSAAYLTTADWDADGKVDLAVLGDGSVSLFYGNGDGTLGSPIHHRVEEADTWMRVMGADVNADGLPDLLVTEINLNKLLVFINRGGRAFDAAVPYPVGSAPTDMVAADFNRDGKLDLAVANHSGRNMSVLLNRGDGTFLAATSYPGGNGPSGITSADFNGDGKPDLAMTHYNSADVYVYFGDGTGRFTSGSSYPVGSVAAQIITADFNGDGKPDLATADEGSNTISVLYNEGGERFRATMAFASNPRPHVLAGADLDGDGDPDIVVSNITLGYFSVLENPVAGNLLPPTNFDAAGAYTRTLAVGDFNGDGRPDVAVGQEINGTVVVCINETPRPASAVRALAIEPAGFVGGCGSAQGVVTLTVPAPAGGAVVALTSNNPAITLPATVTVPAGSASAAFSVSGAPVTSVQSGTVLASFNGTAQRVPITVRPIGITRVAVAPLQVVSGKTASGELTLDCQAPAGGLLVTLRSSHSAVRVPASVMVAAGATTATFTLTSEFVTASTAVTVTASYGGFGQSASVTVLPDLPTAAPAALVATTAAPGQIRLTWSDNSSNETGFEVERKSGTAAFARVATVAANTTTFNDSGLAANITFTYRVRAVNASGSSVYSNEASAVSPPNIPATPTQLTATGSTPSQITLAWRDNSSNETGFEIERKTDGAPFTRIGTVGANVTGYVDTGLDPGSTHRYRMRAVSSSAVSGYSNEATATTPGPPAAVPVQRIAVFRPGTREWFLRNTDGSATLVPFGGPGDVPVPADYLGLGSSQIAVFRPTTREWFLRDGAGLTLPIAFPVPGETPVPADYLGLGRGQVAIYRAGAGEWHLRRDDGSALLIPFGGPDDVPVPADYLGQGRAQIAVFRPPTGEWFLRTEGGGAIVIPWGAPGDVPIPADYFGLGRAQTAVYRPSTAEFFLRDDLGGATRILYGVPGDRPIPADYRGLGRAQIAVFRPSTREWFLRADNGATTLIQWGGPGDVPVSFTERPASVTAAGGR